MTSLSTAVVPQPKPRPLIGNLPDLDPGGTVQSFMKLAQEYGPIYRLELPSGNMIIVSSQQLVDELCDERRFEKALHPPLLETRDLVEDALFTAETREENWAIAHRILMPAFGPAALRSMFPGMADIAEQLMLKWERQGSGVRIDLADNATRLTLDTIALCSFNHRFNSLYSDEMNPFVAAMVSRLEESGARTKRPALQNRLMVLKNRQYDENKRVMYDIADRLIEDRRRNPRSDGAPDVLDTLLTASDPETGRRLSDENIRYQLITFLVAGHETTSGLITFTLYELMNHPEVVTRAREQVEAALGNATPRFEHLAQLGYLDQILKETLRLWPTAPGFALRPLEKETTLGGRYPVRRDDVLLVLSPILHRDPAVWPDPESFDPHRFEFERAEKLPPNSWKPFGNGMRACIGRGFALQEATLFLAMLLQRFDVSAADPNYRLKIHETLTIKPAGFSIHAHRRPMRIVDGAGAAEAVPAERPAAASVAHSANGIPVSVLYGSNAGSSEAFAQRIANDARQRGYTSTLASLDSAAGHLPTEGAVVIVTASYEGLPPDNARKFVDWAEGLTEQALSGVRYAVFGCGNVDWARTYQAVPKQIDARLAAAGAQRLLDRGEANARGDFFGDFETWYEPFWLRVGAAFGQTDAPATEPLLEVSLRGATRDPLLRQNKLALGTIVANRELVNMSAAGARSKRHIEIALPAGTRYAAGDYLAVLPLNPASVVDRALARFDLAYDAQAVLSMGSGGQTFLPTDQPVTVGELLASYVELSQPASRRQIEQLAGAAASADKAALQGLIADDAAYQAEILGKRISVLDLLERYPALEVPLASFLQMLAPLVPRQYSISSSPLWSEDHVTLTVAVLNAPAWSGNGSYEGVASTYLAHTRPGTKVAATVRPSGSGFRPPDSLATPMVMVCAGTGVAPFRGFLQERALRAQEEGIMPAGSLLFFGCDHPDVDYLYRDEFAQWEQLALVSLRPAFSEMNGNSQFVQDRLWADRADVVDRIRSGAIFYVCGDGRRMAPAVHDTCARIYQEASGATAEEADVWLTEVQRERTRYVTDVFA